MHISTFCTYFDKKIPNDSHDFEKSLVIKHRQLPARMVIGGCIFGRMVYHNIFSHIVGSGIIQAAAGTIIG